jgi:hypothetical protein
MLAPQRLFSMTVSVVNGFVCYSSCDESKAKKGQDPHPATGLAKDTDGGGGPSRPGRADEPAVVFGGSLRQLPGAQSVAAVESIAQPADSKAASRSEFSVDLLV